MKKILFLVIVIGVIGVLTVFVMKDKNQNVVNTANDVSNSVSGTTNEEAPVKEFTMTSFVDMSSGSPKPQYSLKDITVNKGDKVRIKITVTSGMHDFKIDEYGVYADTELNKESVIEFTADKAGDFVYYCTKPNHRQNGHWGTLKVI